MACLGLVTFCPLPDLRVPSLNSSITVAIFLFAGGDDFFVMGASKQDGQQLEFHYQVNFSFFRVFCMVNWLGDSIFARSVHGIGMATGAPGRARTE